MYAVTIKVNNNFVGEKHCIHKQLTTLHIIYATDFVTREVSILRGYADTKKINNMAAVNHILNMDH